MPSIYEAIANFAMIRECLRSPAQSARDIGTNAINYHLDHLANGSYLENDDAKTAVRTLLNDAMARPDDQPHPLFIAENWRRDDFGVTMFRWSIADGTSLDLVMRFHYSEDEDDTYSLGVEWAAPLADEDED